jgi:hypothetical protein
MASASYTDKENKQMEKIDDIDEFWAMICPPLSIPHIFADASIILPAPAVVRCVAPAPKGNGFQPMEGRN